MQLSRRRVLGLLGTTGLAAVAGCTGDSDDSDDPSDDENASDPSPSDDPSEDGDGSDPVVETARQFAGHVFAGEYVDAHGLMGAEYADLVPPAGIERTHVGIDSVVGAFREILDAESTTEQGVDVAVLELDHEDGTVPLHVSVTDDVDVAGFGFGDEYERASYVDPDAFTATDVTLAFEGCDLGATLTIPTGEPPFPGVVLVHGSHPTDRDGTNGPNAPYRDLAEGLSSRGVAVLRYDKRSFACPVSPSEHTVDHVTVDDAVDAVSWLRDRDAVDASSTFVVGHSLGAMMAPDVARRDGNLAGIVGLAAPSRSMVDLSLDQMEHLTSVTELEHDAQVELHEEYQADAERVESGEYEADEQLLEFSGAFWDSLEGYDPVAVASDLSLPQYYLQGERDYQVTVEDDFAGWEAEFGDDEAVSLSTYPDLDHLFFPGDGPSVPEAYAVPNEVAEAVVADLADWIDAEG